MNDDKPLVSIIVACYNAEKFIDLCFQSLLDQTYQNFEIVVCDDGSKDNSYEKLLEWKRKDDRIVVLRNESNLFAAETRNRCFKASRGSYFLIQDVDDVSKPHRLERLLEVLCDEPDIDFVSSRVETFHRNPEEIDFTGRLGVEYPTRKNFLWDIPFFHPATLFTRRCIDDVNGYRVAEETRRGQDYDLFARLYAKGYRGKNIPDCLYLYRKDCANFARSSFKARLGVYKIRNQAFKDLGMMPWAYPFTWKPVLTYFVQQVRMLVFLFRIKRKEVK